MNASVVHVGGVTRSSWGQGTIGQIPKLNEEAHLDHYQLFIDGEFVDAEDGATFESIDPGNETPIATVARAGKRDAEAAIAAARRAFDKGDWSGLTPAARAAQDL